MTVLSKTKSKTKLWIFICSTPVILFFLLGVAAVMLISREHDIGNDEIGGEMESLKRSALPRKLNVSDLRLKDTLVKRAYMIK